MRILFQNSRLFAVLKVLDTDKFLGFCLSACGLLTELFLMKENTRITLGGLIFASAKCSDKNSQDLA